MPLFALRCLSSGLDSQQRGLTVTIQLLAMIKQHNQHLENNDKVSIYRFFPLVGQGGGGVRHLFEMRQP